jgi:hypothetical protein
VETLTAEAAGTQRRGYETACADCGTQTTIHPENPGGPHYCQPCWDRRDAAELARVDAELRENFANWSTPELEEYVSLADRELGGYHTFCHDAAAAELDRRRRAFNPDYFRYVNIEDGGEALFAGTTDEQVRAAYRNLGSSEGTDPKDVEEEDPDEIARVESGYLDPYDMRDCNDV